MKNGNPAKAAKRKSGGGRAVVIILLLLFMLAGAVLMLTPYVEYWEQRQQVKQEVVTFKELVAVYKRDEGQNENEADMKPAFPELREAMAAYNEEIYENGQNKFVDAWSYQADIFNLVEYGYEEEAIGVVSIPGISVEMPLYLGGTYENMAKGFAQLSQTSMPIGGENTNCVIAGHRGWRGMPYMRDVELLEVGDSVYVQNPWETLEYRISEIFLIEPNNIESILIQKGRDLLTVVTCHPYGVGSHRYVLICERYETEEVTEEKEETKGHWIWEWHDKVNITTSTNVEFESSQKTIFLSAYLPWICLGLAAIILLFALLILLGTKLRKKKRNRTHS